MENQSRASPKNKYYICSRLPCSPGMQRGLAQMTVHLYSVHGKGMTHVLSIISIHSLKSVLRLQL